MSHNSPFSASSESLEESLLPKTETEAEIIFSPPVPLGSVDLIGDLPSNDNYRDIEAGGMIMGPNHPIFQGQQGQVRNDWSPPGARFDPIHPIAPGGFGEPDFDELLPPGGPSINPLAKTVRPPQLKPKIKPSPPFNSGHPHGAPPGPGNPPFFM